MKFAVKEQNIAVSNNIEVRNFGIVSTPKFFKILSSGLYSNNIRAIIRELSTNARDAHIENGNVDQPFDIHMPTWSDSTFWIRDYGRGMSPEIIQDIYSWYGASNRDHSNEYSGMMGLGSKTPFSYNTQSFVCQTWNQGVYYSYSCFLDAEGKPAYALMDSRKSYSSEPPGTKISFSVGNRDYFNFESEAKCIYRYFKVKPKCINKELVFSDPNYVLEGTNWKLRDDSHPYKRSYAIMGEVAYPISIDIGDLRYKSILAESFDIFFDIGMLNVEASREGLTYDNRTKLRIDVAIKKIVEEISSIIEGKINDNKSLWKARCAFNKLEDSIDKSVLRIVNFNKLTWNGIQLFSGIDNTIDLKDLFSDDEMLKCDSQSYRTRSKLHYALSIYPHNVEIYENDLTIGFKVRVKERHAETNKTVYVVKFKDDIQRVKFIELLGMDDEDVKEIKKISSIILPKIVRNRRTSKTEDVMTFQEKGGCPTRYWKNENIDLTNGGVYIEWLRYNVKIDGKFDSPDRLSSIFHCLRKLCIIIPTIYGVKSKRIKKFKKHKNWVEFSEWVTPLLLDKESKLNVNQCLHDRDELVEVNSKECDNSYIRLEVLKLVANRKEGDIRGFIELTKLITHTVFNIDSSQNCVRLRQNLHLPPLTTPVIKRDLLEKYLKLSQKYALLMCIRGSFSGCMDEIIKYVKMKERENV